MQRSLVLSGVGRRYGEVTALQPTDLTIEAGEFLTLLGPSGSGKTTLLMAIAGFVEPSSGRMVLDGRDITLSPPEERNFGVVFQGYALFPHLNVWENVYFPLRARNMSRRNAAPAVEEALELMELASYAKRLPRELSGGQQQRVALARALVFKPELLLLDEPLSALDKALRKTLQTELKALHRRVGTTFLYVTHDQEEALSMSDRIAILRDGRIEQIDDPQELYWKPRSQFVAGFLGRSNFFAARVLGRVDDRIKVETAFGEIVVDAQGAEAGALHAGLVAVRPERLTVSRREPTSENRVQGRLTDVTFFGTHLELEIDVAGTLMEAIVPAAEGEYIARGALEPGAELWIGWSAASTMLLPDSPAQQ